MKQKFTYLLSLMLMCILGVSNAVASSESDLATISANHTVVFAGIMNGAKLEKGKLYDSNYILSKDGNNYASNKGTNSVLNALNCCRIKSNTQDRLVFKVSEGCTLIIYGETREDRLPFLNTDGSATPSINGEFNKDKGTSTFTIPAAGTYYIVGGNGDRFLAGLQFIFAAKVPPTIGTDLPATKTVLRDETVVLSPSINNGVTYQWYKCNDANKTGATAITGATAPSYSFKATSLSTSYYYCVGSNDYGEVSTSVCAVTVENAKYVSRNWLFNQQSKYAADQAEATDLWGGYSSDNKRYENARALANEELSGKNGPLYGLAGIYFTAPKGKLLLGGKDDNSRSMQTNGSGISMTIPGCRANDKITLRWSASSSGTNVTITYGNQTISCTGVNRNNTGTLIVDAVGDVTINFPNKVRLFEVTVSSKYYFVTDFELSTDEVSVEEFENVSVSAKNFTPSNYTDGTMEWTTSDAAVATVNNGVITGVKAGTATITATSVDGPSKTVEVTVTPCAPKNVSIEMTSNSDAAAPKVESGKNYTLTAKVQGYGLTYQWASKATEKGSYANISGATAQTYEATAVELGSKFYKVTVTNAQGSAVAEYEVKTVVPLEAFTIANEEGTGGINYKALDADEPEVRIVYQIARADEPVELEIADSVEYAGVTYAVKVVGEEAFVNDMTVVELETTPVLREIGARAFMACVNLADVELADGLEIIGDAAFAGCNSIKEFFIPGTVQYVGFKAFADCASLTDIYYDGTKAEWEALPNIKLAGIAKSVTIHFNDGETENGKGNIVGINNANADEAQKNGKFFENGELVIYKNGKAFTAAGAEKK